MDPPIKGVTEWEYAALNGLNCELFFFDILCFLFINFYLSTMKSCTSHTSFLNPYSSRQGVVDNNAQEMIYDRADKVGGMKQRKTKVMVLDHWIAKAEASGTRFWDWGERRSWNLAHQDKGLFALSACSPVLTLEFILGAGNSVCT